MLDITFELEQTEKEKEFSKKYKDRAFGRKVIIKQNGKEVGHIFTPSGSGNDVENAIQVCGFSQAFDLWGCGIYKGYKDIQLLFDGDIMGGQDTNCDLHECPRCFRKPCKCETKEGNPFTVKSSFDKEFKKRLKDE